MDEEPERVFFRNRLSRENGDFRFFFSRCPNAGPDATPSLRLTQVLEEVLRSYLVEIGLPSISCANCETILVAR
jgi:hypothetical protein